ncbi:hypothetical protein QVD17_36895 [Tagetes erecta]|uniref:Uncharacterized protein n=1 Tax=Tagetes erecta TaxID=13708 RepID=A0AAD8NHU7_TARER|nr:hypothetical protein QVD17_36895 [Tagetes erecta]
MIAVDMVFVDSMVYLPVILIINYTGDLIMFDHHLHILCSIYGEHPMVAQMEPNLIHDHEPTWWVTLPAM